MAIETSSSSPKALPLVQEAEVTVSVIYDDLTNGYVLSLTAQGEPGSGDDPGDLVLEPGIWNVSFKLTDSPTSRFALGPILTGPSQPAPTPVDMVVFHITQVRTDEVNMSFTLEADSGNCEYAIRVLAPDGSTIVKDPKVINRGYPPVLRTPPLIP